MIITTTGYYNTGSSAITHILKEFDDSNLVDDVNEIRLLYDPDGIDDLRYHLIDCPHRQNTSFAVKRFIKFIKYNSNVFSNHHYEKISNRSFKKMSYKYIQSICDFSYPSISHIECYEKGVLFTFLNRIYQKFYCFFKYRLHITFPKDSLVSRKTKQFAGTFDKQHFLFCTQQYVMGFLNCCNKNNGNYLVIDQLFPPTNISRYREYLPEKESVVVFIVDRDPRDLYCICKYFGKTSAIPCKKVQDFCEWFKWTRNQSTLSNDPDYVVRIQFEDLIYKYEKSRDIIAKKCNLDLQKCSKKGVFFDPSKSINNTQVWKKYPQAANDIAYIEKELSNYCYDFSKYSKGPSDDINQMFEC